MRRLARCTAILATIAALACLAFSRVTQSILLSRDGAGLTEIALIDGNVRVSWEPRVPYRPAWAGQANRFGFRYNVYSDGSGYAWVPLWVVAVVAGVTACATAYVGWRRPRPGLCPGCGYDLRASPEQCPECGYRPPKPDRSGADVTETAAAKTAPE